MTIAAKATLAWLLLFVVMFANGAIRVLVLQPQFGAPLARQIASLSGVALVLLVSWRFVRVSPEATSPQLWWVGVAWLGATVAFEFLFGHFVSGLSWQALLADYNVLRGRLWSMILISVCLGPWFWAPSGPGGDLRGAARPGVGRQGPFNSAGLTLPVSIRIQKP